MKSFGLDDSFSGQASLLRAYKLRGQVAEARLLELALLWERFDIARFAKEGPIFYSKLVDIEKAFSPCRDLAHRKRLIRDLAENVELGEGATTSDKLKHLLLMAKCRMLKWALTQGRLPFIKVDILVAGYFFLSFNVQLCFQLFFETMDEHDASAFLHIRNTGTMVLGGKIVSNVKNGRALWV